MADLPASLTTALAASATGFGAVIDGVLNIRTVSETRNMAAFNALYMRGFIVHRACQNPDCDCVVRMAARLIPGTRIVPVDVRAAA